MDTLTAAHHFSIHLNQIKANLKMETGYFHGMLCANR